MINLLLALTSPLVGREGLLHSEFCMIPESIHFIEIQKIFKCLTWLAIQEEVEVLISIHARQKSKSTADENEASK